LQKNPIRGIVFSFPAKKTFVAVDNLNMAMEVLRLVVVYKAAAGQENNRPQQIFTG
jgi:hypothetical protein